MKGTNALLERARAQVTDRGEGRSSAMAGTVGKRNAGVPGRAAIGGLLVALAAIGAYVLAMPNHAAPPAYVVVTHEVAPGSHLDDSDLATVPIDLPPDVAAASFTDPSALRGAIALAPIGPGELVQAGAVGRSPLTPFEMSLSLDGDRALDGRLVAGERVAVMATYGTGADAVTLTVASSALVERISKPTGLAIGTEDVVTLGLPIETDMQAVVHAARAGELTLVRTDSATSGAVYQPPIVADPGGALDAGQ
jgi:SAF domain